MAKVTSNYLSEIRGDLGNSVNFRLRRNGIDMSRPRIPSNPNTPAQQATRNRYGVLVGKWQALPQVEKDDFIERAKPLNISGWNLYLKEKFPVIPPSLPCLTEWALTENIGGTLNENVDCDEWSMNPNPPNQSTRQATRIIVLENPWEGDFSLEAQFTWQDKVSSICNQLLKIYSDETLIAAIGRTDSHSSDRYQEYSHLNGVTLNPDSIAWNNYVDFPVKIVRVGSTTKTYYNNVEKQSAEITAEITKVELLFSFWEHNDGIDLFNKWKIINPVPA